MLADAPAIPDSLKGARVLLGLGGSAGQPGTIARALRSLGVDAESLQFNQSKFAYKTDRVVELSANPARDLTELTGEIAGRYNLVHFHARPLIYTDNKKASFPHALDLLVLKAAGVRVVFHYRGSEIRLHSKFREFSPFHYVDENPDQLVSKFPEDSMVAVREFVTGICDRVLVPDPELGSYVPGAGIVPRAIELEHWRPAIPDPGNPRPLVVHAPSRRTVKGTDAILAAVDALRTRGLDFDFELIEKLPNDEARRRYEKADIIIDQLRIGWYGVLAVEGMALGKPVVSYIRDDIAHTLGDEPPLAIADPNTITEVLAGLITDPNRRAALGERARAYCERVHCAGAVGRMLLDEYDRVLTTPPRFDPKAAADFLWYQQTIARKQRKKLDANTQHPIVRLANCLREHGPAWTARRIIQKTAARNG